LSILHTSLRTALAASLLAYATAAPALPVSHSFAPSVDVMNQSMPGDPLILGANFLSVSLIGNGEVFNSLFSYGEQLPFKGGRTNPDLLYAFSGPRPVFTFANANAAAATRAAPFRPISNVEAGPADRLDAPGALLAVPGTADSGVPDSWTLALIAASLMCLLLRGRHAIDSDFAA
jgi:hypothetical protein